MGFVKGDFMKLVEEFGENSFDAGWCFFLSSRRCDFANGCRVVYAIEATCHAPSWEGVYDQIRRVLKPGGVFGLYEWCMTSAWDPTNPAHVSLQHEIEFGNGIPEMRSLAVCRSALLSVGFELEVEEDLAERADRVPWYYPLEGDIWKAQTAWDVLTVWRISPMGRFVSHWALWFAEKAGVVPKGTYDVAEALKVALASLVKGGQTKVCLVIFFFSMFTH